MVSSILLCYTCISIRISAFHLLPDPPHVPCWPSLFCSCFSRRCFKLELFDCSNSPCLCDATSNTSIMTLLKVLAVLATLTTNLLAQGTGSTFSPARPPAIPLAVRSPYLSTWLRAGPDGGNGGYLAGEWPIFWTGQVTGWTGMVMVDGLPYLWMGDPPNVPLVNQTAFSYTSTR